jgi:hypothetical protein
MRIPLQDGEHADKLFLPFNAWFDTNIMIFCCCRTMCLGAHSRHPIHLFVHLLIDAAAVSNFELLRPHSQSSWKHSASILLRVMYKTRFQFLCPFRRPLLFCKWLLLIQWSVPLQCGAVSSCFRILHPKFCNPRHGYCCHFF